MFKRSLQVSVVKDKKTSEKASEQIPTKTTEDYVQLAREVGKDVVIAAAVLIGSYIVLDTVRQSTVKIVEAKVK
jgi:hypothetical protein